MKVDYIYGHYYQPKGFFHISSFAKVTACQSWVNAKSHVFCETAQPPTDNPTLISTLLLNQQIHSSTYREKGIERWKTGKIGVLVPPKAAPESLHPRRERALVCFLLLLEVVISYVEMTMWDRTPGESLSPPLPSLSDHLATWQSARLQRTL